MGTRGDVSTLAAVAAAILCACAGPAKSSEASAEDGGGADGQGTSAPAEAGTGGSDGGGNDSGVLLSGDSGYFATGDGPAADASACQHLNIGILGNPGTNPSANFQTWLVNAGTSVQRIQTAAPTPPITAATLQPFDVVVLDWLTRDYTATEAGVLAAFVSAGGGLITMSGYDNVLTDDWHANSLLGPLEVAYSGPLLNPTGNEPPVASFASHPITAGIASVSFKGGYAISDLGGSGSTRTPIAFLPDPADAGLVPVGYAIQMGRGHAFVWGDEWISFDSEWVTMPQIKQLWVQVFGWVAPGTACPLHPLQ